MNYYETLYIIHPALDAGRIKEMVLSINKTIEKNGGKTASLDVWGKKKLAYEIDKQKYGTYILLQFTGDGSGNAKFNMELEHNPNILAYLTTKIDKSKLHEQTLSLAEQIRGDNPATVAQPSMNEKSKAVDEPEAVVEETSAEEESKAVDEPEAVVEETSAGEESKAVDEPETVVEETSTEEEPEVADESETVVEETSAGEEPEVADESETVVEETSAEEEPEVADESETVVEETSAEEEPEVADESETVVEETSIREDLAEEKTEKTEENIKGK